jgi:hypothetical protein
MMKSQTSKTRGEFISAQSSFTMSRLDFTGINFTNILRTAFTRADPKSAKKTDDFIVFFALLGSACVLGTIQKIRDNFLALF